MTVLNNMPRCVVFDLDGTLVDTGPDLTAATNHILSLAGRPPVTITEVRDMVGLGARKLIERGLAHTGGGTPEQAESLLKPFLDYYAANVCETPNPFPELNRPWPSFRKRASSSASAPTSRRS
ncbi:HAD hydrolase-like protein [Pedomonas mirosovicensis]|uniref:HAD hydrolase-like protein n=1 Tax=Pedomonas mirosovicensis TaxID=2908641 RepID=UPI002166FDDE|nr:HAD hydrolase-like protein [Pedomonas mirosovicensis]MCH8684341.1 HAD hydrolase-like protein [Pedomonas mirosovicensis]